LAFWDWIEKVAQKQWLTGENVIPVRASEIEAKLDALQAKVDSLDAKLANPMPTELTGSFCLNHKEVLSYA